MKIFTIVSACLATFLVMALLGAANSVAILPSQECVGAVSQTSNGLTNECLNECSEYCQSSFGQTGTGQYIAFCSCSSSDPDQPECCMAVLQLGTPYGSPIGVLAVGPCGGNCPPGEDCSRQADPEPGGVLYYGICL
jgi:hypothetical protein